jgi:hypothetical protein
VAAAVLLTLAGSGAAGAQTRVPSQWPFTASSPWNASLGTGAKYESPACDLLIRSESTKDGQNGRLIPWINAERYSMPVFQATSADPLKTYFKVGVAQGQFHVPAAATPAEGTDRSMIVIEPDGRWSDESWLTDVQPGAVNTGHFVREDLVGDGGFAAPGGTGIRAARASILGGLIRTHELQAGKIPHALAIALPQALMAKRAVPPATGIDGDSNGYGGIIPMGQLMALAPGVSIDGMRPLDKPLAAPRKLSTAGRAIATALKTYGAYVVDTGGATALYAEPGAAALVHPVRDHYDGENHSELKTIIANLSCVSNNAGPNWGGGGAPLAPPPPPFG